jgi:NAD-dependent dihydropyrimidine dehydrogenase PreA subunit
MRSDGTFIAVEVDDAAAADPVLAAKLAEACPVDIFAQQDAAGLQLVEKNLDECVLCRLCLDATPAGTVKILKLYDGEAPLA